MLKDGRFGVQAPGGDAAVEAELRGFADGYSGRCTDDLPGQILKDALVLGARANGPAFFHSKSVWLKVPKAQPSPNYRSRLVARQVNAQDYPGRSYFAPAPPLEALRAVVRMAMTDVGAHKPVWDHLSPGRVQISLVDIKKAYSNAGIDPADPPTFVQLPPGDADSETMVARLLRHMYGTRMAADGWQEEYSTTLVALGFTHGGACPTVFRHVERSIVTSVRGDDFTSSGLVSSLDWLEDSMASKYESTIEPRLGPGPAGAKEYRVLSRVIRCCEDSIGYEADPRQVERPVAECGLGGAKSPKPFKNNQKI